MLPENHSAIYISTDGWSTGSAAVQYVSCTLLVVSEVVVFGVLAREIMAIITMPPGLQNTCRTICPIHRPQNKPRICSVHRAELFAASWIDWFSSLESNSALLASTTVAQRTILHQFGEVYRDISLGLASLCPREFTLVLLKASHATLRDILYRTAVEPNARDVVCVVEWARSAVSDADDTVDELSDNDVPPLATTSDWGSDSDSSDGGQLESISVFEEVD